MPGIVAAAVRNNAAWVDAVARSQGVATRRDGRALRADGPMPPFYPNLMTLDPTLDAPALVADPPRGAAAGWGLKDSFAALDLTPEGFVPAFDATWIACDAAPAGAGALRLATPDGLARWTRGWGGTPGGQRSFCRRSSPRPAFASTRSRQRAS